MNCVIRPRNKEVSLLGVLRQGKTTVICNKDFRITGCSADKMEWTHDENSASVQTSNRPATYETCSEPNADDHHYASFAVESASFNQNEVKRACCASRFTKCALMIGLMCLIIVGALIGLLTYAVLMAGNVASNLESSKHTLTLLNKTNLQLQETLDSQSQYITRELKCQISALRQLICSITNDPGL